MYPAVFLDRDGVIIQNRENYVRSWNDVEFLPSSLYALERLSQTSHKIIIITNQSAVGRGIITLEQAEALNRRVIKEIEKSGGRVDRFLMCPHAPEEHCFCRKPQPGLIQKAAEELSIDLESSALIGDALTDIQAGAAAGIKTLILVKTGRGREQFLLSQTYVHPHFLIANHLLSAIDIILSKPVL
jgi:D-glycero-D-manno-heptose 1,7-bisphosphate phosphatase